MRNVIQKADVLVEALPYIQRFRGETIVVKFGGSIMDNKAGVSAILNDVAFMACVGLRPVLVHGGGKAITAEMKKRDLKAEFRDGLRVTDEQTVRVVEEVLNNRINPHMVGLLQGFGCKARGIHGEDILRVRRRVEQGEDGVEKDWGYVGEVVEVDMEPVKAFLTSEIVPLVTPLGRGPERHVYNVNADEAASAMARATHARKLVFLSDVPGVLSDPTDGASVISSLRVEEIEGLIGRGVIAGGMLPKIAGALNAVREGVNKAHIIDSSMPHSLLLELFTDKGVGTEILA